MVCSLFTERNQVSATTCAMCASMLLIIKKKGGTAQFYFNGERDCSTLAVCGLAPAPVYIGDVTP